MALYHTINLMTRDIRKELFKIYISPGFLELYFSNLPSSSANLSASGNGSIFIVMFGQISDISLLYSSHLSAPGSVSAWMASTGHSGAQTPQSIHSSGCITIVFSPI